MRSRRLVRTVVLAVASLALAVGVYGIYQYSESKSAPVVVTTTLPVPSMPPSPAVTPTQEPRSDDKETAVQVGKDQQVGLLAGEGVNMTLYTDDGRPRARFAGREWRPLGSAGDEIEIIAPDITLRTDRGELVHVTGDRSQVQLKSADLRNPVPKSGRLSGNVRIVVDRRSDELRQGPAAASTPAPRTDEQVLITLDDVFFDMEYARVETAGPFTVEAPEVSITGTGLHLFYNELDSRIDELAVGPGPGRIEVRSQGRKFGFNPLGGAAEPGEPRASSPTPSPTPSPAPAVAATPGEEDVPVVSLEGEKKRPRARPTDEYVAVFESDVEVIQTTGDETSRLVAERLEVLFDFGQKQREEARQESEAAPVAPESGPTAAAPPSAEKPAADDRIVLTWDGKLNVTSRRLSEAEHPPTAPPRVHVIATGRRVEGHDPQRQLVCGTLVYRQEQKFIQLLGAADQPAHVSSADMGEITGREIVLDSAGKFARAKGPGGRLLVRRAADFATASPADATAPDSRVDVRFEDELHARFDQIDVERLDPRSGATVRGTREILTGAAFSGNVDMAHGDERIQCDRIDIDFAAGPRGELQPTAARAFGNVVATQGRRYIAAGRRMLVDFEMIEKPKPPFDQAAARRIAVQKGKDPDALDWDAIRADYERKKDYRPGISRLQAEGDVEVRDPAQGVEINCAALDAGFAEGKRLRHGLVTPADGASAYVGLGEFSIASSKPIPFDVDAQTASVDGEGRMTFVTRQDLDGSDLDEPRPVAVKWSRRMTFDGLRNEAVFLGDVHVESTQSTYDCAELRVDFVDAAPPPGGAAGAASRWWLATPFLKREADDAERFTLTGPRFDKDPIFIYATGNVIALNQNVDPVTNRLQSRTRIAGPTMAIDLREEYVTVPGQGTLLIEDYRLRPKGQAQPAAANERPRTSPFGRSMRDEASQTFIAWETSMRYRYKLKVGDFQKNVSIVHRTGAQMVQAEKFLGEPLDEDASARGSEATLNCQALAIEFLQTGKDARAGVSRLSGYDVGAFNASGQVHFTDVGVSALAQQITYTREDDVLQILGSDSDPAQVFVRRKRVSEMRGPKFIWDRAANRIWAPKATGGLN